MKSEAKRRRSRKEIEEDKQEEQAKELQTLANVEELSKLRAKVRKLELESKQGKKATSIVQQMIAGGMVQQDAEDSIVLQGNDGAQQRIQAEPVLDDEDFFEADGQ